MCVDVPRLSLDRPFTYLLDEDMGAGMGSLVSVPFHGRVVRGWVLGPTEEAPPGRLERVRKVRSPVRFFDERMLSLLRWVGGRYIAPLATVIDRSHPPRVVGEEAAFGTPSDQAASGEEHAGEPRPSGPKLSARGVTDLLDPGTVTWLRPLPGDEVEECLRAVRACLERGRRALVLVPETDPLPATAAAVIESFPERAVAFAGGDARARYLTWLRIRNGLFDVVVGTRPAVFAPLARLGLIWVSREVHPGHREDRAPYYHVREVSMARARIDEAACVISSLSPSAETAEAARAGAIRVARAARSEERRAAPLVETVPPEAEDRSGRLGALVRGARSAALIVSRRGYGVARVCRSCGDQAACAVCGGPVVAERGSYSCRACGAPGRCRRCGGSSFGVEPGGTERVAEWAGRVSKLPVIVDGEDGPAIPSPGRVVVGTAATVNDVGPVRLDVVAVLDPDRAISAPGIHAGERALATWMEAAAWAGPRDGPGRVLVQTRRPGHPAVQALVRWDPLPYLHAEAARRAEAGVPPGHGVFRVEGGVDLPTRLREVRPAALLATAAEERTVCLVTVRLEDLPAFRDHVVRLAESGAVTRVEAEPQL